MFANHTWLFFKPLLQLLTTPGLLMTLFYLTRYSETLTKRKTDAEKALKQHNQSQPTTECNNVKSDRNQYCISTYPPSRMLERKDNWAAAGGLTWEKQPDNWREKSWNRLRVHVLPRRDWGDGEKYLSSCFQIIIGTLEMYLKKNRKTEKASNLFLQLRNSEKCSLLGCFGGFLFLIILLIILNIMQEHFLVLGLDWPFTEKPRWIKGIPKKHIALSCRIISTTWSGYQKIRAEWLTANHVAHYIYLYLLLSQNAREEEIMWTIIPHCKWNTLHGSSWWNWTNV